MSLFQNSVLRNHLQNINHTEVLQAFELYKKEFLPKIANIKTSKEEQYQYGFLDDLFVTHRIDKMVYGLYELSEDEVAVVEGR